MSVFKKKKIMTCWKPRHQCVSIKQKFYKQYLGKIIVKVINIWNKYKKITSMYLQLFHKNYNHQFLEKTWVKGRGILKYYFYK